MRAYKPLIPQQLLISYHIAFINNVNIGEGVEILQKMILTDLGEGGGSRMQALTSWQNEEPPRHRPINPVIDHFRSDFD